MAELRNKWCVLLGAVVCVQKPRGPAEPKGFSQFHSITGFGLLGI